MQFSLENLKSTGILRSEYTSHNLKNLNLTKMSKITFNFFFFLWSNSCSIIEEAEAEIDILEDLEQLNVKTTNDAYDDDDDDSAFIIIESKSGAKDNVIESFFNDPKKFTKSPPRLQSSAVDSSSSSFKKFNKLSQKERKKQQKQQHSKLYYIYVFKTKTKKLIWCIESITTWIFLYIIHTFFPIYS